MFDTSSNSEENTQRRVLIADDDASMRIVMRSLMRKIGYQVVEAKDGAEAIEAFREHVPDMVLMDVMMPRVNGFEAAKEIKALAGDYFVPLLFLNGAGMEEDLAQGAMAGGDDYILKPLNFSLLQLKIRALERIQELHHQIQGLYSKINDEHRIAESVYSRAVTVRNVALDVVHAEVRPASVFSGDMVLTAYTPERDFYALLGDFSGHGLNAALGALPASEVFRAMSMKGYSPGEILESINIKLYDLLPTGMFLAAQCVAVHHDLNTMTVCNCGMPDLLVIDGESGGVKHQIGSSGFPLGIARNRNFISLVEHLPIQRGDRAVLTSDGVVEAINDSDEQFDDWRLEYAVTESAKIGVTPGENLLYALDEFCGTSKQRDDISVLDIPCVPELLPNWNIVSEENSSIDGDSLTENSTGEGQFSLTVDGGRLRRVNPVPLIMNNIQSFIDLGPNREIVHTILTELYVNALDYGLLGLDSSLKRDPKGFSTYFRERDQRLSALATGTIRFTVHHTNESKGKCIHLIVEDSGSGFDFSSYIATDSEGERLHGRGIRLIHELCSHVTYCEPGNRVEATYCWFDLEHGSEH